MKFNITYALVGVGALALIVMAQRKRQAAASPDTHNSETAQSPGQWWSYAGAWSTGA